MKSKLLLLIALFSLFNILKPTAIFAQKGDKKAAKQAEKEMLKVAEAEAMQRAVEAEEAANNSDITNPYDSFTYAIPTFRVSGTSIQMNGATHDAFEITLPNTKPKDAEKSWKKWMKKAKAKTNSTNNLLFADNANIKAISTDNIDTYARFNTDDKDVQMIALFDKGDGFIDPKSNEKVVENIGEYLNSFAVSFAKQKAKAAYKQSKKDLKQFKKDLKKTKKENKKNYEALAKYRKLLADKENQIEQNVTLQKETQIKIQEQAFEIKHKKELKDMYKK